jgi:hypothetical protein
MTEIAASRGMSMAFWTVFAIAVVLAVGTMVALGPVVELPPEAAGGAGKTKAGDLEAAHPTRRDARRVVRLSGRRLGKSRRRQLRPHVG